MLQNIDIVRNHTWSWMCWANNIDCKRSTISYILKAIKDKSSKNYGIILFNTFINITEFKNTFINSKKAFVKLCYITVKGSIKLHIEKLIFNIKKYFKCDVNSDIIFE